MKFTNKHTQYQSKRSPFPTYMNSYVRDGKIEVGENSEYLKIDYLFCHVIEGTQEVVINRSSLRFDESHQPTTIQEDEQELEVYEAILSGVQYDKTKITQWGKPDLHKVMGMFELESLTNKETGLIIKDLTEVSVNGTIIPINAVQSAQIKQLMIDWLYEKVVIENEKLGINFDYQV